MLKPIALPVLSQWSDAVTETKQGWSLSRRLAVELSAVPPGLLGQPLFQPRSWRPPAVLVPARQTASSALDPRRDFRPVGLPNGQLVPAAGKFLGGPPPHQPLGDFY